MADITNVHVESFFSDKSGWNSLVKALEGVTGKITTKIGQNADKEEVRSINADRNNRAVNNALFGKIEKQFSLMDALKKAALAALERLADILKQSFQKSLRTFSDMAASMREMKLTSAQKTRASSMGNDMVNDVYTKKFANLSRTEIDSFIQDAFKAGKEGVLVNISAEQKAMAAALYAQTGNAEQALTDVTTMSINSAKKLLYAHADIQTKAGLEALRNNFTANEMSKLGNGSVDNAMNQIVDATQAATRNAGAFMSQETMAFLNKNMLSAKNGMVSSIDDKGVASMLAALGTTQFTSMEDAWGKIHETMQLAAKDDKFKKDLLDKLYVLAQAPDSNVDQKMIDEISNGIQMAATGNLTKLEVRTDEQNQQALLDNTKDGKLQNVIDRFVANVDGLTGGFLGQSAQWIDEMFGSNLTMEEIVSGGFSMVVKLLLAQLASDVFKSITKNMPFIGNFAKVGSKLFGNILKLGLKGILVAAAGALGLYIGSHIADWIWPGSTKELLNEMADLGIMGFIESIGIGISEQLWPDMKSWFGMQFSNTGEWLSAAGETLGNLATFIGGWLNIIWKAICIVPKAINVGFEWIKSAASRAKAFVMGDVLGGILQMLGTAFADVPILGEASPKLLELANDMRANNSNNDTSGYDNALAELRSAASDIADKYDEVSNMQILVKGNYKSDEELEAEYNKQKYAHSVAYEEKMDKLREKTGYYDNKKKREDEEAKQKAADDELAKINSQAEATTNQIQKSAEQAHTDANSQNQSLKNIENAVRETSITSFVDKTFAQGGIVSNATPAMIGEAGKEAVLPLTNSDNLAKVLAGLSGDEKLNILRAMMGASSSLSTDGFLTLLRSILGIKKLTSTTGGSTSSSMQPTYNGTTAPGDDPATIEKIVSYADVSYQDELRQKLIDSRKKRKEWFDESLANASNTSGRELIRGTYAERALAAGVSQLGKHYILKSLGNIGYVCNELTDYAMRKSGFDMKDFRIYSVRQTFSNLVKGRTGTIKSGARKGQKKEFPEFRLRPDLTPETAPPGMVFFSKKNKDALPGHIGLVYYNHKILHSSGGSSNYTDGGFLEGWQIPCRGVSVTDFNKSQHYEFGEFPELFEKANGEFAGDINSSFGPMAEISNTKSTLNNQLDEQKRMAKEAMDAVVANTSGEARKAAMQYAEQAMKLLDGKNSQEVIDSLGRIIHYLKSIATSSKPPIPNVSRVPVSRF